MPRKCDNCVHKEKTSLKNLGVTIGNDKEFDFCRGHFEPIKSLRVFNFNFDTCYKYEEKKK